MSALRKDCLYVGIRGHVVALDTATGAELWRTKLKGSDYVSVTADGGVVYAASRGEVFALDPHAGTILWHNKMRGLGLGIVGLLA
jgi:outer membrane protein assembly factor BamB